MARSQQSEVRSQQELETRVFGTAGVRSAIKRVGLHGVRFGQSPARWYYLPELKTLVGKNVEIRYDPDDESCCWLITANGIVELPLALIHADPPNASQRDIITQRQWVELSRLLTERARSGFSGDELATVNGFINYVAPDVEAIQTEAPSIATVHADADLEPETAQALRAMTKSAVAYLKGMK